MLGGSNNNSLVPLFVDETLFRYPSNASNQLQLFGNAPTCNLDPINYSARDHNTPAFRPNKRLREPEANLMQKKLQISLNHNFYNDDSDPPSTLPNPHHVSTGLKLSYDDEERNSSVTSASASMTLAPSIMSSFGDSVATELDRQKEDFERYIRIQEENMLKGMRDIRQRHTASFLAAIEKGLGNKLHEKDLEIESINHKNKQLVDQIKHIATEAQNWHRRAKYQESIVNLLKTNLQQALAHGPGNQIKEGFGDTDEAVSSIDLKNYLGLAPGQTVGPTSGPADGPGWFGPTGGPLDPKNYLGLAPGPTTGLADGPGRSTCRVCKLREVSVLVMPCRHLSLCKECDGFTGVCPVCEIVKTVSVEVYLS